MIIAIDYDETYTRDPNLWNWFCGEAMIRGYTVYCISARSDRHMGEVRQTIGRVIGADRCIGTDGKGKRNFAYNLDIVPDVWIDDAPESIPEGRLLRGLSEATA